MGRTSDHLASVAAHFSSDEEVAAMAERIPRGLHAWEQTVLVCVCEKDAPSEKKE